MEVCMTAGGGGLRGEVRVGCTAWLAGSGGP